ncbi:uncharacterized protein IUM83_17843 [Phytophthora cinnamomi]|uniref:uncharacterized protein n=1 Tax=Phytophthora cinnamomi TaxID=4785 RepID=UPI00355A79BD|nr:hypothetical protein IUM83_17843 [Phytophthora cinnamomi]
MRRLHAEIDDLQQVISVTGSSSTSQLRSQIDQQAAEIQDLDRRLARARQELEGALSSNRSTEHNLDLATSEIADLRSLITVQEHDLDLTRHDLDVTSRTLDRVQADLTATESAARSTSPTQIVPHPGALTRASLQQDVDRLEADLRQARGALSPIRSARDAAQARVVSLEAETQRTRRQLDQSQDDLDAALTEDTRLRKYSITLCSERAQQAHDSEITNLRSQLDDALRDVRLADAHFADVQQAYGILRRAQEHWEEALDDVSEMLTRVLGCDVDVP